MTPERIFAEPSSSERPQNLTSIVRKLIEYCTFEYIIPILFNHPETNLPPI